MCRFFAYCLQSHNSVSFIPLKYVKFNLPCKYLPRGMNAKHDVIYTSGYVCLLAVILVMVILKLLRGKVDFTHATIKEIKAIACFSVMGYRVLITLAGSSV